MTHRDDITLSDKIRFGSTTTPMEGSKTITLPSGFRKTNLIFDRQLRVLETSYRLDQADAHALNDIWQVVSTVDSFRARDWRDWNTTTDMTDGADLLIGPTDMALQNTADLSFVGDGATTTFQAVKTYSAGSATHVRVIQKLRAGALAAVNEVEVFDPADFTVDLNTGIFTFAVAPPAGQTVKWGGVFDIPVHFVGDDGFSMTTLEGGAVDITGLQLMEERL
jgi:uncharacterized protein (TIGR02217 family)